jgi:uncharacterized Zn finger protein
MRIELNCAHCGGNRFDVDKVDSDDSLIRCQDCGHLIGTLASLKDQFEAEVIRASRATAASASLS